LADFWLGLEPEVWATFSTPSAFGKEFLALPTFQAVGFGSCQFVRDDSLSGQFPFGVQTRYPRNLAHLIVEKTSRSAELRRRLKPYLERFAHFFCRDFLVTKAIETLNAELKPEHAGFRKAFSAVFDSFKREAGEDVRAMNVDEYCYKDDYFTQLDLDKTQRLFAWIGLVKAPKVAEMCPICCEDKMDVELLDHWEASGDISSHKMCGSCRSAYGKNECPFCKEVLLKDEFLSFITEFTNNVHRNSEAQQQVRSLMEMVAVSTRSAQLMEHWQLFEMEHDGNARLVRRVAKLVINDFTSELQNATAESGNLLHWLRDIAGVVFRLHALIKEKEVDVSIEQAQVFEDAVERILLPFEQSTPTDLQCGPWDGHFYGHLYNQVLVAWLCAFRSNVAEAVLRESVRRVGLGITRCVSWYEEHGQKEGMRGFVAEVMHKDYLKLSHAPCWGSKDADAVWQTFYTSIETDGPAVIEI